jgi:hypothetical protein
VQKKIMSIRKQAPWLIAIVFLGAWLGTELILARWGDSKLPIEVITSGYTSPSDILFMGNSRVATAIKPSLINQLNQNPKHSISSYNLGVGSTDIGIHYLLLKRLVEKGKQPKVLIYGFVDNDLTRTNFPDDYNLPEASKWNDWKLLFEKSLTSIDSRSDWVTKKLSRVYRYRFIIRSTLSKRLTQNQVRTAQINKNAGGFQDFRNIVEDRAVDELNASEKNRYKELYEDDKSWLFNPSSTYLEDLVKLCAQTKIRLVFIEMPVTKLRNKMAYNSSYRKLYFNQLKTYLKNNNIPLYNLSTVSPDKYIPDTMHLSDEGATFFTLKLFDVVIQQQNLCKCVEEVL